MPKLTVLMPVYNGEKYLKKATESVLNQTFEDYEFLIIDDKSQDGSKGIITSCGDKRIRFIQNERNLGQMQTLNIGVKLSRGQYIARIDQDDTSLPERFEKQVEVLDRSDDIALVYSDSFIIDGKGIRRKKTAFDYVTPSRLAVFEDLLKRNFIAGNTVMIRKSVFEDIGLYNPAYKIAAEYDFFLRLTLRYGIDLINIPLAEYRAHENNISRIAEKTIREVISVLVNLDKSALTKKQKSILNKALSWHKSCMGMCYLFQHNRELSKANAMEALKINPLNGKALMAFFMSVLFPDTLIDFMTSFRRGWLE